MLTQRTAQRHLVALSEELEAHHWNAGRSWYADAHYYCAALSQEFSVPLPAVVGALAVMSPQTEWNENKRAVRAVLATGSFSGQVYPANVKKALRLVAGERFEDVTGASRYGHKVRAFYDNILRCDESEEVTVDTHAIRAAFNSADVPERELRWVFESNKGYETLRSAYQHVAQKLGARPLHFQAAIWLLTKERLAAR